MADPGRDQLDILRELYPELDAGGFTAVDGTIQFYTRINALLQPDWRVVDYGAGRGEWTRDPVAYRREIRTLRGKVSEMIGVDVDDAVLANPAVDRSIVLTDAGTIPLPDASVDLLIADHTFEHLDSPSQTSRELARVVRPGGWICARTPNRWGYIALATSVIPNARHVRTLRRLQPGRESMDVFPTRYRLNTRRAVSEFFPPDQFEDHSYFWSGEPCYFGRSRRLARMLRSANKPLPPQLQPKLFVFLRKRDGR